MAAPMENATSGLNLDTIDHLTDISEIRRALDALDEEEDLIGNDLDALLEHQRILETKMAGLQKMIPNLQLLEGDSKQLTDMISFTSTLAENVSSKVRQLDLAKSQVTGCLTRVEDILDLKFCTDGVQSSLHSEDYETAAGHIHRFRSLDENILRMTSDTAEGSQLEISFKLLHESEDKLRTIVHNKFDAAVHSGDLASVERFFKIFPLVGLYEEGLTKYGKFLASQLSERAENDLKLALAMDGSDDKRANVLYADTLTLLFESIAKVVDTQQPLVETYYGPGKLFTLLKWIQRACDRHARKLVEEFKKKREFESKAQQVQQSMMFHKQANSEKLDPKDLDPLLSEVALLSTRTELYLRFMRRRSTVDMEIGEQQKDTQKERESEIEIFFTNCELGCLMQEQIGTYIMMEEYFMREMVLKAVSMDSTDEGQLTSSMVDDTFFIVKKCVRRSISSRSVDGVCAMLNHACTTLEQDFREVLFSQLRLGFPSGFHLSHAYNLVQSSLQSGKIPSSDTEKEKAKTTFLVSLNNSETSCDYLQKLKGSLEEEVSKAFHTNEQSQAKLETCLSDLSAVSNRLREAVEYGLSQLQSSAIKPRIKPIVETFLSTNHNITEDEFSNYEANDPWVQNFIVSLDTLLATFKSSLTSANYDSFVTLVTNEITTSLEKSVMKSVFNRLGGLQFDKELRSLVAYLTSVTTWTIRDKFARLTQMATILNMEKVTEIVDYWGPNSGPLTWRLTPTEVRQILSLRIDFRSEDIKRLKL